MGVGETLVVMVEGVGVSTIDSEVEDGSAGSSVVVGATTLDEVLVVAGGGGGGGTDDEVQRGQAVASGLHSVMVRVLVNVEVRVEVSSSSPVAATPTTMAETAMNPAVKRMLGTIFSLGVVDR